MPSKILSSHFTTALKHRDIRFWIGSVGFFTLASRALAVVIGFQVYKITHSALALGWLGLIEAVPALSLVLIGGYVADHFSRHKILVTTRTCSCLCALALALLSRESYTHSLAGLYTVIFLAGIARGFSDPATTAFEAQVVPKTITVNASSWIGSIWVACSIIGPAIIGFVFAAWGAFGCYMLITAFFSLSWASTLAIGPKPQAIPKGKEPFLKSVSMGWHFVLGQQPLWGAMTLDLIAVLFGGVIALLPIYATDILHAGPQGLGLLNAATSVGALSMMLYATKHPPIAHAGRNLLFAVAGFGVSVLIFGFSKNFILSLAALALSGVFDGVSMVIRRSMVRLLSPDDMRGRISAVSWIFICSSNELGAFESGMVAAWIGAIPCVAVGGVVTLGVAAATACMAPQLRRLRFDPHTLERIYRP
ncbi:MAG: MFS transporter [Candidatus Omnitrophica bacterium]|nr:MFS transporter [Candidatus Omnitrophota bacterium]MDE2009206.1 MFS transporter [Candidatus Omnitrophota bacterium]MDE2213727.1 MFS transporter [Candidatus Omnitrophota bacterium]MDE2230698.1 MFS transporter [Candidatus Omnitrophota bacterium]